MVSQWGVFNNIGYIVTWLLKTLIIFSISPWTYNVRLPFLLLQAILVPHYYVSFSVILVNEFSFSPHFNILFCFADKNSNLRQTATRENETEIAIHVENNTKEQGVDFLIFFFSNLYIQFSGAQRSSHGVTCILIINVIKKSTVSASVRDERRPQNANV